MEVGTTRYLHHKSWSFNMKNKNNEIWSEDTICQLYFSDFLKKVFFFVLDIYFSKYLRDVGLPGSLFQAGGGSTERRRHKDNLAGKLRQRQHPAQHRLNLFSAFKHYSISLLSITVFLWLGRLDFLESR